VAGFVRDEATLRFTGDGPPIAVTVLTPRMVRVELLSGVLGGAMAVGGVEGAREAAAPRPAVLADLAQGLDDEWVLPDPLLDRRELAGLHELGELGRFPEAPGELRRVR